MEVKNNNIVIVFSLLLCLVITIKGEANNRREKLKSIANLGVMAATHIPCSYPYFPIPYGCWCGPTRPWPSPFKPIDEFDEICKSHDWCYQDAIETKCLYWEVYLLNYKWHDENGKIICDQSNNSCQMKVCQCDKDLIDSLIANV